MTSEHSARRVSSSTMNHLRSRSTSRVSAWNVVNKLLAISFVPRVAQRDNLKERREKAPHAGKAQWACFFQSPLSLDPDADSVTHISGDGFGSKRLEQSLAQAIQTELLFGELELVAERIAPHHLKKPCRVSLLDLMKHHITGEAEVSALAHAVQMPVLRPHLEGMRQPASPDILH